MFHIYDNNLFALISIQGEIESLHLTLKSHENIKACISFLLLQITTNLVA